MWVGRRLGLFVARCCCGFHAVKVAQKVAERGVGVVFKKLKNPFLLRFLNEKTGGQCLNTNVSLAINNVALGAAVSSLV